MKTITIKGNTGKALVQILNTTGDFEAVITASVSGSVDDQIAIAKAIQQHDGAVIGRPLGVVPITPFCGCDAIKVPPDSMLHITSLTTFVVGDKKAQEQAAMKLEKAEAIVSKLLSRWPPVLEAFRSGDDTFIGPGDAKRMGICK